MNKTRVAVLISGSGSNLQALIDACDAPDYPADIVCVISNKEDAYGLTRAKEAGIQTVAVNHRDFESREAFDNALHKTLIACEAEIVCLAGFMRILTPEFVKQWEGRMLNIHPSLLPEFKGLNTHERALEAGVKEHGCTVHLVTAELDDGPILAQAKVEVVEGDTPQALAQRVLEQEHVIYVQALKALIESRN